MHTVMTIERSIADVSSKHPKATNPRISSICEKLSPTSLAVGRITVGELDCTGTIKLCDASLLMVVGCIGNIKFCDASLLMVVGAFCEGSTSTVRPLTVVLGAISQMVVVCEDGSTCGGAVGGGVGISPAK